MRKTLLLAGLLALGGCDQAAPPAPVTQTSPPVPAWQQRAAALAAVIKVGMTEDEVVKVAGDPGRTKSRVATEITTVMWEYDLGENRYFKVQFDKNLRVAAAQYESEFRIQ